MHYAPEHRHPTLAGAASTGPPVPTSAATAVVAVHGLGGVLDRVRCRGTLALQDISIVTVVPTTGFSAQKYVYHGIRQIFDYEHPYMIHCR